VRSPDSPNACWRVLHCWALWRFFFTSILFRPFVEHPCPVRCVLISKLVLLLRFGVRSPWRAAVENMSILSPSLGSRFPIVTPISLLLVCTLLARSDYLPRVSSFRAPSFLPFSFLAVEIYECLRTFVGREGCFSFLRYDVVPPRSDMLFGRLTPPPLSSGLFLLPGSRESRVLFVSSNPICP